MLSICGVAWSTIGCTFAFWSGVRFKLLGHFLERAMTIAATASTLALPPGVAGCGVLRKGGAAERKRANGGKCDEFEFHMLWMMTVGLSVGYKQFRNDRPARRVGNL